MHLDSHIIVEQSVEQVWALLNDPYFLIKWDRSVEQVIPTSDNHSEVAGFTFDTIAPKKKGQKEGMRMSYRIIEHIPGYQTKILLESSNMFKSAIWTMRVEATNEGTLITCEVDLKLKPKYFILGPVLFFNKKALVTDLKFLKKAIETHYAS